MSYLLTVFYQFLIMCSMFFVGISVPEPRTLHNIFSAMWPWALAYWIVSFIFMFYRSWKEKKKEREFHEYCAKIRKLEYDTLNQIKKWEINIETKITVTTIYPDGTRMIGNYSNSQTVYTETIGLTTGRLKITYGDGEINITPSKDSASLIYLPIPVYKMN